MAKLYIMQMIYHSFGHLFVPIISHIFHRSFANLYSTIFIHICLPVTFDLSVICSGRFGGKALPSAGGLPFLQSYMSAYNIVIFTSHVDGKALPSAGGLPFLQSYMSAYNICYLYRSF